jgi:hypothetical protein
MKGVPMIFTLLALVFSALLLIPKDAQAQTVSATLPYSVSVFVPSFAGQTGGDSIAFNRTNVFVGYAGGVAKDGSDGKPSTIVEYDLKGTKVTTFSVTGHNDGLRIDAKGNLWALQNEDANPNLVVINPKTGKKTNFTFPTTPHKGGYDDVAFAGSAAFITASNPSKSPNTDPAVVSAKLRGRIVALTEVLAGNASAINVVTGKSQTLNLQDPDSMILDPSGELVFTSQADMELVVIEHPGLSCQKALVAPLTTTQPTTDSPMADDTVFTRSGQGQILFVDKTSNIVYSLTTPYFAPGAAYTAYQGSTGLNGFVGQTDLSTGLITPLVTGLGNPGGMAFIASDASLNDPKVLAGAALKCP